MIVQFMWLVEVKLQRATPQNTLATPQQRPNIKTTYFLEKKSNINDEI